MLGVVYNYQWLLGYVSCGLSRGTQISHGSLAGRERGENPTDFSHLLPTYLLPVTTGWAQQKPEEQEPVDGPM